jgi:biopolymer transport protein ExbB
MAVFIRLFVAVAALLAAPAAFAAPAFAAPAFAADDAARVVVDNPYGLDSLWAQGDLVARATLLALVVMSMATWYILVTKLLEQHQLLRHAKAANAVFWKAASPSAGLELLAPASPLRAVVATGLRAVEHHDGALVEKIDLHTWVTISVQRAVGEVTGRLQGGLAVLATVGSTAPFVGLFGTVWGIYHALTAIGIAGQASIDKVAGPVGEALIMTALGLAVAVPAVLGYNWLARRNRVAADTLKGFGCDLHAVLLSGMSRDGMAQSAARPHLARVR